MKNNYKKYAVARTDNPAFILNQIGKLAIKRAQETDRYKKIEVVTAQLMCSFTLEATLNHIGFFIYTNSSEWSSYERKNPREKLEQILNELKIEIDFKKQPFCNFQSIFTFRDQFAHGKTMILRDENIPNHKIDFDNFPIPNKNEKIKSRFEKTLSIKTAEIWRENVYEISKILSAAANCFDPVRVGDMIETYGEINAE